MKTRRRLLCLSLAVVFGLAFTGAALRASGMWSASPVAVVWPVEGEKPGQAAFWGENPDDFFAAGTTVGDVNGDGYEDLIAAARYAGVNGPGSGEVYVLPGPLAFDPTTVMPDKAALVFQGQAYQQLGVYLESGDLNGDGLDEMIFGDLNDTAHIYPGSAGIQAGTPQTVSVPAEPPALSVYPAGGGFTVCDFNADGFQDLFVQHFEPFTVSGDRLSYWGVLGGADLFQTQPLTLDLRSAADIKISGFTPTLWYAPWDRNIDCADIDGDGVPDLALGIFGESPDGREEAGRVYIVPGDPALDGSRPVTLTMPAQAGAIIEGIDGEGGLQNIMGDRLGAIVTAADVDLDGRADLILGAPGASGPNNQTLYAGEVYLWLGRALEGQRFTINTQASWVVSGRNSNDQLADSAAAGDFDRDGAPEIVLGCSGCEPSGAPDYLAGQAYVLEPLQLGGEVIVSAASQLTVVPYDGARCLGSWVDAMDLEHDGADDLLAGAPCTDYPEGVLPGTLYAIRYPLRSVLYLPFIQAGQAGLR